MARIRSIKPGFCTSEDIACLTIPCRLHFVMLWTYADDEGRGMDNARLIKGALWPLDDEITVETVEAFHDELQEKGRIVRYVHDGRRYFEIRKFREHQHPQKPQKSPLPAQTDPLSEPYGTPTVQVEPVVVVGVVEVEGEVEGEVVTSTSNSLALVEPSLPDVSPGGDVAAVFDAWIESTGRTDRTRLDAKRRRAITQALKAYPVADVIDAVRGWRHSPHHAGQNDTRTVYNDLGLLLRDAAHIEKFRDLERGHGPAPVALYQNLTVPERLAQR